MHYQAGRRYLSSTPPDKLVGWTNIEQFRFVIAKQEIHKAIVYALGTY